MNASFTLNHTIPDKKPKIDLLGAKVTFQNASRNLISRSAADLTLDIILLSISILIILALIVFVTWFCCKRRKKVKKLREKNFKVATNNNFPEIAIIRSRMFSSEDSTNTKEDTLSVVSSIWDSTSQKFDKTFLEQKVVETNHNQSEKQDIKTKNSGDVNQCCCLDIESNKQEEEIKDEVESKKDSQRDFVIKESASI